MELGAGKTAPDVFRTVAALLLDALPNEEEDFPVDSMDLFCWLICLFLLLCLDFILDSFMGMVPRRMEMQNCSHFDCDWNMLVEFSGGNKKSTLGVLD